MTRRTGSSVVGGPASYQQMTASDIATKIAQQAGLQIGEVAHLPRRFSTTTAKRDRPTGRCSRHSPATNDLEIAVREGKFLLLHIAG